jgi:type IV pilus assembly protein PilE
VAALTRVQQAQERWRASHATYTADLGSDGLKVSDKSPDGHYALQVTANNATTYTVIATASATSPQSSDTKCKSLQIRMVDGGGNTAGLVEFGSTNSGGTLTTSSGNPCWIK